MFGIGLPELILLMAIALIVLGPDKLPQIARILGKTLGEIKRATEEVRESLQKEALDVQQELKEAEKVRSKGGPKEGEEKSRG